MAENNERLRELIVKWRNLADNPKLTGGDSEVENAYNGCAQELEAALAESGAGQTQMRCIGCDNEWPLVNGQHYGVGTGMFYPCTANIRHDFEDGKCKRCGVPWSTKIAAWTPGATDCQLAAVSRSNRD